MLPFFGYLDEKGLYLNQILKDSQSMNMNSFSTKMVEKLELIFLPTHIRKE